MRDYGNEEKLQSDWCWSVQNGRTTLCIICHQTLSPRVRVWLRKTSTTWCESSCPLSGVKRCLLFGGSVCISYIGGSASAKARCPLDGGVRYLECPLKEVPLYSHSRTIITSLKLIATCHTCTNSLSGCVHNHKSIATALFHSWTKPWQQTELGWYCGSMTTFCRSYLKLANLKCSPSS